MRRIHDHTRKVGGILGLAALVASSAHAATFEPAPIAPELGLEALDRSVTEEKLGRALLSAPYAVAALGTVDVYDVFPYLESRFFVVVADPAWNRLLVTETGSGTLASFDGAGTTAGPLAEPHGLAVDRQGRLYVCDTGNDRLSLVVDRPHLARHGRLFQPPVV